jgi:hypothetical protein
VGAGAAGEGEGDGTDGEGEGTEGEGEGAEGEGEGTEGEGEGGEGEGEGGEGEGEGGEGEGEGGEGEGEGAEGEGEGGDVRPRPPVLAGVVTLATVPPLHLGGASAFFAEPLPEPATGCVAVLEGTEVAEVVGYDAGSLLVEGATVPIRLEPRFDAARQSTVYGSNLAEDQQEIFVGGERLTVTGQGGAHVAAFRGVVWAPMAVNLLSPTPFTQLTRDAALPVLWDRGDGNTVVITVTPSTGFGATVLAGTNLVCVVADTGSTTVPADLVRQLPAAAGGVIVSVTRVRQAEVEVDAQTTVQIQATNSGGSFANFL